MTYRSRFRAVIFSAAGLTLLSVFCAPIERRAEARPTPPVRTPECTIDISSGTPSDCALAKAKDEWILWSNPSSGPRSVHFASDANPFSERACWDVAAGARARSGPIALGAALKTYIAYTADAPCSANPSSDSARGAINVTVQ